MGSGDFLDSYNAALASQPSRDSNVKMAMKSKIEDTLRFRLKNARARAKSKGMPCDISMAWAKEKLEKNGYSCEMTRLPFCSNVSESKNSPYSPSLDRIDCAGGYTKNNVRIVLAGLNIMMLDWGEDVFNHISSHYHLANSSRTPKKSRE